MRICPPRCEKCRWKTSNVQHRTSNAEVSEDSLCHSMFGVGCSSGFMERPPRTLIAPCALEPTHRPLTPSLSPSAGERVPEGRERRRFMESPHDFSVAHWDHEPLRLTEARSGPRVCDPQPAGSWTGGSTQSSRNFHALWSGIAS